MNPKYREVCERLEWSVYECGDGSIELEKYSPAGEDFSICVGAENFVDNVKEYAASLPSIKELVKDAEDIDKMLKELAEALFQAELAEEGA